MKKKPSKQERTAKGRMEKDIDDLVHSTPDDIPSDQGEQDPDDLVHRQTASPISGNVDESLADPDDLVHGADEDDEDER